MTHLLALVLLVGIVDSLNPSTIAPALYLAAGEEAESSLAGFIAGAFAVNLGAGILIALGPGQALLAVIPRPGAHARHLLELTGGGVTLAVAIALWIARDHVQRHVLENEGRVDRASWLVGAGIMLVELPTAIPYFAVIAAVIGSGHALPTQLGLVAIFNVAYFAPLLAILGIRGVANERGRRLLERIRANLNKRLSTLVPVLVLIVAAVLITVGAHGLAS